MFPIMDSCDTSSRHTRDSTATLIKLCPQMFLVSYMHQAFVTNLTQPTATLIAFLLRYLLRYLWFFLLKELLLEVNKYTFNGILFGCKQSVPPSTNMLTLFYLVHRNVLAQNPPWKHQLLVLRSTLPLLLFPSSLIFLWTTAITGLLVLISVQMNVLPNFWLKLLLGVLVNATSIQLCHTSPMPPHR